MKFRPMSVRPVLCALFAGVVALAWSASPLVRSRRGTARKTRRTGTRAACRTNSKR